MKKLLKNDVCGSRKQCTDTLFMEKSTFTAKKKKKAKRDAGNVESKSHLNIFATDFIIISPILCGIG